jgi:hypothetical protein
MFAFILGTSPVFFAVAYFTTRLGATLEKYFTRIVAVTVIVLGLVSINSGLNLAGSPFSFNRLVSRPTTASVIAAAPTAAAMTGAAPAGAGQQENEFLIHVNDNGYSPQVLHLPAERPVSLNWVTQNTRSCALSVVVPDLNFQQILPQTGQVALDIPAQPKNTVIRYSCSMGMYTGEMVFDQ